MRPPDALSLSGTAPFGAPLGGLGQNLIQWGQAGHHLSHFDRLRRWRRVVHTERTPRGTVIRFKLSRPSQPLKPAG